MSKTRIYGNSSPFGTADALFTTLIDSGPNINFNTTSLVSDLQAASGGGTYDFAVCSTTRNLTCQIPDSVIPDQAHTITVTRSIELQPETGSGDFLRHVVQTGGNYRASIGLHGDAGSWEARTTTETLDGASATLTGATFKSSGWGIRWFAAGGATCWAHTFAIRVVFTLPAPVITTVAPDPIGKVTATLKGTFNAASATSTYPAKYRFEYDTTGTFVSPTVTSFVTGQTGATTQNISAAITGLDPSTTYYFRVRAENDDNTVFTSGRSFVTANPTISTGGSSSVTPTSATVAGTIDADDATATKVLTYLWEYGPSVGYGSQTSTATWNSAATTSPTVGLTGLTPNTTYHYRFKAYNSTSGDIFGSDQTFTTLGQDVPMLIF